MRAAMHKAHRPEHPRGTTRVNSALKYGILPPHDSRQPITRCCSCPAPAKTQASRTGPSFPHRHPVPARPPRPRRATSKHAHAPYTNPRVPCACKHAPLWQCNRCTNHPSTSCVSYPTAITVG